MARRTAPALVILAMLAALVARPQVATAAEQPVRNGVTAHAGAPDLGPPAARDLAAAVVGLAATPSGSGYWQVARDGGVFSFGDAQFHGSAGGIALARPVVAMARTRTGGGYWLAASDGGVFAFGDARFYGSMGGRPLNQPVVGMAATPSGEGYWLVARDGGIFAYGDARFHGSTGDRRVDHPVVGMASSSDGAGYWLASRSGEVFGFGVAPGPSADADVRQAPVVAIAAAPGGGYWLAHGEGGPSWQGHSLFPEHRVVAYYGSPASPRLGVLGVGTPADAVRRLMDQVAAYRAGGRPVIPTFELIATLALASPGPNGLYSNPMPDEQIRPYLDAIRSVDGMLILDIQPGRGDLLTESRRYDRWLREPDVGLALDPEWAVGPDERPGGGRVGSIDAADINRVSAYLSELVEREGLPEKVLVVHRFTPGMVTNAHLVVDRPGVAVVFHTDGFGTPEAKLADYRTLLPDRLARGIKIFYQQDIRPLSAPQVLALEPPVDVVTYQ